MSDNSNSLSNTLSLFFWSCILVFSILSLIYPYTSISGEDKLKLQDIFLKVESTPFKKLL
jgi:di/tricarboxylate transporter